MFCNFTTVFANLDFLKKLHKGKRLCELLSFATSILISLVTDDAALDPLRTPVACRLEPPFLCSISRTVTLSVFHLYVNLSGKHS